MELLRGFPMTIPTEYPRRRQHAIFCSAKRLASSPSPRALQATQANDNIAKELQALLEKNVVKKRSPRLAQTDQERPVSNRASILSRTARARKTPPAVHLSQVRLNAPKPDDFAASFAHPIGVELLS